MFRSLMHGTNLHQTSTGNDTDTSNDVCVASVECGDEKDDTTLSAWCLDTNMLPDSAASLDFGQR